MVTDTKNKRMVREYYKRRLYGARTPAARAVDFVALRAVLLLCCYLWFADQLANRTLRLLLALCAMGLISVSIELFKSIRLDRFKIRERQRIRTEYAMEQLLLMPGEAYAAAVHAHIRAHRESYADAGGCLVYPLQRSEPIGEDTLLSIYRLAQSRGCHAVLLFCPAPMAPEARVRSKCTDIRLLQDENALLQIAQEQDFTLDDEGVDARILDAMEREKRMRREKSSPLSASRTKRYLLVAFALFGASFFVRYTLYYRLMAAVCLSLGSIAWLLERTAPAQKP